MTGHHAGPRKDRGRFFRTRDTAPVAAAPAETAPAPATAGHIPFEAAPGPVLPRRVIDRQAVAAGLRARAALTAQRDIPTTLLPALQAWTPQEVPREYAGEPVMPYWNPGERTVAVDLAGLGGQQPEPRSAFASDLGDLPHFRATCKTRGWCGLAMRKGGAA